MMMPLPSNRTISLFIPCYVDQLAPSAGRAMVAVLEQVGCVVEFRSRQTCCGQPAFTAGHWPEARELARRFVEVFAGAEAIVCPSGSCTAMVRRSYADLAGSDLGLKREVAATAGRVFEFSEFLVDELKLTDVGASFPHRVALHDACHGLRELGVKQQPRTLLRAVRGLELVEMDETQECCGFGGSFSVQMSAASAALGMRKARNAEQCGADYVVSGDPSCLLHIGGVLARQPGRVRTIHLAEILAAKEGEGRQGEARAR